MVSRAEIITLNKSGVVIGGREEGEGDGRCQWPTRGLAITPQPMRATVNTNPNPTVHTLLAKLINNILITKQ